jgi:hypothetical protein
MRDFKLQGLLDEFTSAQQATVNILTAMAQAPASVKLELRPVLEEAMASARGCAKEITDLLEVE